MEKYHIHICFLHLCAGELCPSAIWKACGVFDPGASSRPIQEERFAATVRKDFLNHRSIETVGHVILVPITLGTGVVLD